MTRVTLIAGGVGGAKMAEGFAALDTVELTIIGNIADDEEFHGLWVSPDIDTMLYTLSGRINRAQGWGVADDRDRALQTLTALGADTWMYLGDRDFGLHIWRSAQLRSGRSPQAVTSEIAERFGIKPKLLLPSDDRVQTRVNTAEGWLSFQEYFVRERCAPQVTGLHYEGLKDARAHPAAQAALDQADLIVIAPSNPLVSVAPILGIGDLRDRAAAACAPVLAVSPLIAGQVVKGPADRMMRALGHRADALGVAALYADLIDILVLDSKDTALRPDIRALGVEAAACDILMQDSDDKTRLAQDILALGRAWLERPAA